MLSFLNHDLWQVVGLSLGVSLSAVLIAALIGLPLAMLLAVYRFKGDRLIRILVDTMMAFPPVVVGLIVFLLLSRSGPLGIWGLLYTPTAMIIAQTLLILPIIIALAVQLFEQHWQRLGDQLIVLGIYKYQSLKILISEARFGIATVVLAAFGRAISEIGAVMIVGGNIEHQTRVMTTAIATETQQGNLMLALALGVILIVIALVITASVHCLNTLVSRKTLYARR